MLLPLLGACAVVGPFQGPEWEPVRGLISQDCSCRDPRCCGNLLVLCLFLIWQVRHYWHQFNRTCLSERNAIKVPLQKWALPSIRCETFFRLAPEFFSPGDFRGLDAHVQQWVQKQRWGYRRSLLESWTQYLFSSRHLFQDPSWRVHNSPEPIFCTSSLSSTCLLSQDSSWEAWHEPWCLRGSQTHSSVGICQRIGRLLVHSQEKLVPLEHVLSTKTHPPPMTFAISLPHLPSAQRLQFCSGEFLPDPSHQQMGVPTWKSWNSPQETWAPLNETQTVGREHTGETQILGWANQRESRGQVHAWEVQAPGGQLPTDFGMEHCAEAKDLQCRNQSLVVNGTDGEILIPGQENQMEIENRAQIEEVGKKIQREAGGKNPPETQVHMGENQEQLRCQINAETQTPGWGYQEKSGGEDALEIQTFERKNEKEPREEEEGEIQVQGLGKQGQTGDENAEEAQTLECRKQTQTGGDTGAETEAGEGRNKDQVGNEDAVQTPTSGRENLEDVKQENRTETQALGWGKQEYSRSENITEFQALVGEKQGQGGSEATRETQASKEEKQKLLRHAIQVRQESQDPGRGQDAVQSRIYRRRKLKEIREEDWVVIQTPWWGNQSPVVNEIDRKFKISCWNQNQIGGGQRTEIQTPEENDQRKDGDEDGTDTLVLEAENQRLLRNEMNEETHPAGRKNEEQFGDENGAVIQALGKRNPRGFIGENGTMTQELWEENQGQLGNEFHGNVCIPQRKNQEYIRGKDGTNTQIYEAGNWGELTSKSDGETHSAGWKKVEHVGGESSADILLQGMINLREAKGEDGTETWAGGNRSQHQIGSGMDRKVHLSEWKNQKEMEGKDGTEIQAPKKRKQREPEGEDNVKTQRPERENQGWLESVIGRSHSPGMGSWGQTGGDNVAENQASEEKNQREAGIENGRKIHRPREKNQRLLRSKVQRKTCSSECKVRRRTCSSECKVHRRACSSECKVHRRACSSECKVHRRACSSEWKNQEETGGGNAAEIQIQGKRNPGKTTDGDSTKMQAPVEDDQGQSRREIDGEVQKQEQGNQNKDGDVPAEEIWNVGCQSKYRAEDAGRSPTPGRGDKSQIREKEAMGVSHQGDCSAPPGQEQAAAINSVAEAPCSEMKPRPHLGEVLLLAAGEGEHLTSQGPIVLAREYKAQVSSASQQVQTGSRRKPQKHKGVDPGKTHSLMQQPQNPQSLDAPFSKPSACPSLLCGQTLQAATALVGVPTILTIPPKWPVLKKSKRLLLESLMRRRIAHLKWGLPRRILESYLLFNFFGSCSLPLAGVRLPELGKSQELQKQQEKHCEAQGSMPGFKSPERFPRVLPSDGKSSKLPTQAKALERCRPHRSEPMGTSIPTEKPRRIRPPGGTRETQIQEAAPKAKFPAPKSPRPSAESANWCSPERVPEPSSENSRGREVIRPGVSQKAERVPRGVRTSSSRASQDPWKKEHTSWEASQFPRRKCQQPTRWRRESLEAAEGRVAAQEPSSCSTHTSSFKGSLHSKTAKLSMTLLSKMSWSPQLANSRNSAPNQSLKDPILLSRVGNLHAGEDSIGVHTALERDHQPKGHRSVGVALPRTKSPQGQSPRGAPQNPSAPKKFGFMKHLRYFLFQCGLKK